MLRTDNPFNAYLGRSRCYTDIMLGPNCIPNLNAVREFGVRDGHIKWSQTDNRLVFDISHSHADGPGLLFLANEFLPEPHSFCSSPRGQRSGSIQGCSINHRWETVAFSRGGGLTQRFVKLLIDRFPFLIEESIGIAVSLENVRSLSSQTKWGNSFVVTTYKGKKLNDLTDLPIYSWSKELRSKAKRILRIANKLTDQKPAYSSLLISNMGNVATYGWVGELSPANTILSATPETGTGNVLLWNSNNVFGLAVCSSGDHWVARGWSDISKVWEECL